MLRYELSMQAIEPGAVGQAPPLRVDGLRQQTGFKYIHELQGG